MNKAEANKLTVGSIVLADPNPLGSSRRSFWQPVVVVSEGTVPALTPGKYTWSPSRTVNTLRVRGVDVEETEYEGEKFLPTWGSEWKIWNPRFDAGKWIAENLRDRDHVSDFWLPKRTEAVLMDVRHLVGHQSTVWPDIETYRAHKAQGDKAKRQQEEHDRRVEEWEELAREAANAYLPEGRGVAIIDGVVRLRVSAGVLRTILNETAHPDTELTIDLPAALFAGPRPERREGGG